MVRNAQANPYAEQELWWDPIALDSESEGPVLTEDQVQQWLENGFLIVTGLWPEDLVEAAAATAAHLHPYEAVKANKGGFSEQPWHMAPPASVLKDPTQTEDAAGPENPLNHMTIHPRAISAVAQLMDTPQTNVRLSQSHVIARWGGLIDPDATEDDELHGVIQGDQDIHVDCASAPAPPPPPPPPPRCCCDDATSRLGHSPTDQSSAARAPQMGTIRCSSRHVCRARRRSPACATTARSKRAAALLTSRCRSPAN